MPRPGTRSRRFLEAVEARVRFGELSVHVIEPLLQAATLVVLRSEQLVRLADAGVRRVEPAGDWIEAAAEQQCSCGAKDKQRDVMNPHQLQDARLLLFDRIEHFLRRDILLELGQLGIT